MGLGWAEQTAPVRVPVPTLYHQHVHLRRIWAIPASLAVICLLLLGVDLMHSRSTDMAHGGAPSAETVAQDNELMAAINEELNTQVVRQVPASELRHSSVRSHRHSAVRMVN
jgi:hypothetical protein